MRCPFFSIVLPTKNRSFLVGDAVRSVLRQTFEDFELVVVDNDDGDATSKVVQSFQDARVRCHRAGGLSMPDNWECAANQAKGEYILFLEDKQLLKGRALQRLYTLLEKNRYESVVWQFDVFEDLDGRSRVHKPSRTGGFEVLSSDSLLKTFLNDRIGESYKVLPLLHRACVHRDLVRRIKEGPMGRFCPPVSPDFTAAFLQCAYTDGVVHLKESLVLYGSSRYSNGHSFIMKSGLSRQFTNELGGGQTIYYSHVPVKAVTMPGIVYNDYALVRQRVQGRLMAYPLNWTNYFVEVFRAILIGRQKGVDMANEAREWNRALKELPLESQGEILEILSDKGPLWLQRLNTRFKYLRQKSGFPRLEQAVKSTLGRKSSRSQTDWPFESLLDYVKWEDASLERAERGQR